MADIRIGIRADDHASKEIKGIRGLIDDVKGSAKGSILAGVGLGGGVAAFSALSGAVQGAVGFMGDAVVAAREETVSVAALTQSVQTNSAAYTGNMGAIEAVIKERMALGFADDDQRAGLAKLTAVTKDHNKALELQRVAMDLARLRGMDLGTAGDLIGKVYGGNVSILKRYGIALDEGATATEAIAAIQRMAGGQAEAWADTEEGAAQTTAMAMGELQEQIGQKLLPVLKELAVFARDTLVPALSAVVDNAGAIGDVVGDILGGFAQPLFAAQDAAQSAREQLEAEEKAAEASLAEHGRQLDSIYENMKPPILATVSELAALPRQAIEREWAGVRRSAYQSAVEYAKGLLDGQNAPKVAMDALLQIQTEAMSEQAEVSRLKGMLASNALAVGLLSPIDAVRNAANATRGAILDRLSELGVNAGQYGRNIGDELAAGLLSRQGVVKTAAGRLAQAISGQVGIRSEPKDSDSPLRGITQWGKNIAKELADGMNSGIGSTRAAAGALGGGVAAGAGGGNTTVQLVVDGRVLAEVVNRQNLYAGNPSPGPLGRG